MIEREDGGVAVVNAAGVIGWVHSQQVQAACDNGGHRLATEADFKKKPSLQDRLADVLAAAEADLDDVSRDDLVAAARALGLDPPDRGPHASKKRIWAMIQKARQSSES